MSHTKFGFCLWDILALAVLLAVVLIFIYKRNKMKAEEEELKDSISEYESQATYFE